MPPVFDYGLAFDRNIGWVTPAEQETLRGKRVAIAGMGGVGGVYLLTLARLGVGRFRVADFDTFDVANFNRQVGASMSTVGRPKVDVLAEMALDINPEALIDRFPRGVDAGNVGDFLEGADLYIDGLDYFAFDAREMLFAACAQGGIAATTVAPAGMGAALVNFVPGGMSFEDYFGLRGRSDEERVIRFAVGLAPAGLHRPYFVMPERIDIQGKKFPATIMGCQLAAGVAVTEALKILLGRGRVIAAPRAVHFDAYRNKLVRTWRPGGHRNPLQRLAIALGRRMIAATMPSAGSSPSASPVGDVERIVAAGVRAPSADNRHHFKVRQRGHLLELVADDEFTAMKERHRRVLTLFSYGAVVENMALRASHLGLDAAVAWRPAGAADRVLAQLGPLEARGAPPDELGQAIDARHTNRRMYRGPGPDPAQRERLAAEASVPSGARVDWLTGKARRDVLALVLLAETERFRRGRLHEELYGAVRFDVGWRASAETGVAPATLEVEPPMRPMFEAMRRWSWMRASHLIGGHRMFGLRAGWLPCWQAPALGVVSAMSTAEADVVSAGRGFERLWLRATLEGLALQPLAASAVLALQDDVADGIAPVARQKLIDGWHRLLPGRVPLVVFRLGHAKAPSVRTGRPPVERFLDAETPVPG